ncbi:MAG TPA: MATE family efflux transporter [Bacteroidales bacterium]|nr:MATE family efflux transporter [Bacteroidales bacterium]HBZ19660.1 MATE family efflux transporter [Bacteroidales bacterium]
MKASANTKIKSLFRDIKEAISGTEQDFTEVKLSKAILLLSIPAVLEMIMESIFVVVDIFFVSKLGADAVATVGITESLVTIVYAVSLGLATATTSMVSRRIGEKNPGKASETAIQAILTGIIVSIIIGIPGSIYSGKLLELMGASDIIREQLSGYTKIMLGGNVVIMLLFIINAVFRSAGDAAIAMRVLWVGNIINIILDPCLIFGLGPFPELGVTGAAVATTTGRGIAVLYQFWLLFFGKKRIQLSMKHLGINFRIISKLIRLSLGSTGQNLIGTISWIALVRIISVFGSEIVAGYTIAIRIVSFVLLPSWGISNAASTLVGQNLGAKKPDRAERAVMVTGYVNMILLGIVGLILVIIPGYFINLFIDDPAVLTSGTECLRIISIGFIAYGFGMVLVNSFNGAGDTTTPLKINIFAFWLIEIPLAWILAIRFGMNQQGVFTAIVIAESLMTLTSWLVFRRGKWKLKEV